MIVVLQMCGTVMVAGGFAGAWYFWPVSLGQMVNQVPIIFFVPSAVSLAVGISLGVILFALGQLFEKLETAHRELKDRIEYKGNQLQGGLAKFASDESKKGTAIPRPIATDRLD